jgi:hypothetical protein
MIPTINRVYLTNGCNISYFLEKAGYTMDDFVEFWGSLLIAEKDDSGLIWYDRRQAEAFIAE